MTVLADGRFWAGLILGLLAFWGWTRYQAQRSQ